MTLVLIVGAYSICCKASVRRIDEMNVAAFETIHTVGSSLYIVVVVQLYYDHATLKNYAKA